MFKIKVVYIFLLVFVSHSFYAQEVEEMEQIKKELLTAKEDTNKVDKLIKLSLDLASHEFKQAVNYGMQACLLSGNLHYARGVANSYNCLGDVYWFHAEYVKAQQYYFNAYRISDSIHDDKAVANTLFNIAWMSCIQQKNYKADKYFYQSLALYQKLNNTSGLIKIYYGIASYYSDRYSSNLEKQYFDSAIVYFNKEITLARKGKRMIALGASYATMSELFYTHKDYNSSIYYGKKGFEICSKIQDSSEMVYCILTIAKSYIETNKVKEGIADLNLVYKYHVNHDIKDIQLVTIAGLARGYFLLKDYKKASDLNTEYSELNEKIEKEAFSTNINKIRTDFAIEKSETNIEQLKEQNKIEELKNKRNQYFIFGLIGVAIVVISFAGLLFKQKKQRQLTNTQLKEQNHIIAEKKQEIDSSIQYAKGIQQAILPNVDELTSHIPQSFVYYTPKDVVSGDFYWFSKVGNDFYCVAADCTGHGVPGALMSIIGIEKIGQAIFEQKLSSPSKILSFLNRQIKQVLKQHLDESKQKDGMDMTLLKFNQSFTEVEYAAANRPLLIIRNKEVLEFKADKTAIAGFTPDDKEFTTTKIPLQKNDSLFIFTDGYADQFGGTDGKKFMIKKLKDVLISVSELTSREQKEKIEAAFNDWKGSREQVDDVLIIGITV